MNRALYLKAFFFILIFILIFFSHFKNFSISQNIKHLQHDEHRSIDFVPCGNM